MYALYRWISFAPLDSTDISSIQPNFVCELFLANSSCFTEPFKPLSQLVQNHVTQLFT